MLNYTSFKEQKLSGRYVTNQHITPLHDKHQELFQIDIIGSSVDKLPIVSYTIGNGSKKILAWSQMHGNESTTTKALFDFFNWIHLNTELGAQLLEECTFCIIPILNPDGALRYTRLNANSVDLNRDAKSLSQPESKVLRKLYEDFKPNYCFNLHGQRTVFSAGYSSNSSVLSFLSPAEDEQRAVTDTRKIGMEIIAHIATKLKDELPDQISRYNDAFNINCVGDMFQSLQTPTILFEAGHYTNDYEREHTRKLIFKALLSAFECIANNELSGAHYSPYFSLPENEQLFYDVIIRNVQDKNGEYLDVAIQYEEHLKGDNIDFAPQIINSGDLTEYFGHKEINGEGGVILINDSGKIDNFLKKIDKISIDGEDFVKKISV